MREIINMFKNMLFNKGDIYMAKISKSTRPVLIVEDRGLETIKVFPITSIKVPHGILLGKEVGLKINSWAMKTNPLEIYKRNLLFDNNLVKIGNYEGSL